LAQAILAQAILAQAILAQVPDFCACTSLACPLAMTGKGSNGNNKKVNKKDKKAARAPSVDPGAMAVELSDGIPGVPDGPRVLRRTNTETTEVCDFPDGDLLMPEGSGHELVQPVTKKVRVDDEAPAAGGISLSLSSADGALPPAAAMTIEGLAALVTGQMTTLAQMLSGMRGEFSQLNVRCAESDSKSDARFDLLEARISCLEAKPAVPPPLATSSAPAPWTRLPSAAAASGSSGPPAPAARAATAAAPPPVAASAPRGPAASQNRLWVKGFATTQTTKTMATYAKKYLECLPDDLRVNATMKGVGFGVSFSIAFPSKEEADAAFSILHTKKIDFYNQTTMRTEILRITKDKPQLVRNRDRVMGGVWQRVNTHIIATNQFKAYQLANSNGKLFLIVDDVPTELFKIASTKVDETTRFEVIPNHRNLRTISVPEATANEWAEAAESVQVD
jgi:hypothetical protein